MRPGAGFRSPSPLLVAVASLSLLTCACVSNRTPERNFTTRAEALQSAGFDDGWLPESRVPGSGRNIRQRRDLESNELWARFEFDEDDRAGLAAGCHRIGQQDLRLPASETRGIGWWPEMLRGEPAVALEQFAIHACPADAERQGTYLAVHKSLTTAFYWRTEGSR
jgi:hypothetical protein